MTSPDPQLLVEAARVLESVQTLRRHHGEDLRDSDLESALHAMEAALERLVGECKPARDSNHGQSARR